MTGALPARTKGTRLNAAPFGTVLVMGNIRAGIPAALTSRLRDALGLRYAVETGTYMGSSAAALADLFDRVWTIEWSEELWAQAKSAHRDRPITFVHGSSGVVLREVLAEVDGPALLWLDGHWSGGVTAGADDECPVLAEIAAVDASDHGAQSVILIDDARFFLAPPMLPHKREQWPSLMEVADLARAAHDRYVTVVEDVIVAVPLSAQRLVEDYAIEARDTPRKARPRAGRVLSRLTAGR
jgi:hypothetical protein